MSSTPVIVTVCGTRAFSGVNVSEAGLTVPSVRSELVSEIVTSDAGELVRAIVKVAVPPASVVWRFGAAVTVTPATSSLVMVPAP